ncbi:DUF2971 domain-containing protein [Pseudomonas sp. P1B16]|uniref:DUF2971 domain-containing protein n=1 Tax=Pseudomonas sp. P1B16 TaxID=2986074 RepID=UPI002A24569A|nr:DUF2971 domain-containing protein [Pseudomonas sp. P1B16]WPM29030.1 DUF2971 domain-containing protein [Pseudomonas sp. P1B16]
MKLFHYTDVNAVFSILKYKSLWATDVRFLNDSEEMHNGISILVDYIKHQGENFPDRHEFFTSAVEYVERGLAGKAGYGIERRPVYVCSFSRAEDLLSQWRAYGTYAIEFEVDDIPHNLMNCVYDEDEKVSQASTTALQSLMVISNDLKLNDGMLGADGVEAFSDLVELAATFKHNSFSEEQEVRIIVGHDVDPEIEDGLDMNFRSRGDILIPYVNLDVPFESIKAIHVGPMKNQDLAYISMKSYVETLHLDREITALNYSHKINVVKSSIPYRAQ